MASINTKQKYRQYIVTSQQRLDHATWCNVVSHLKRPYIDLQSVISLKSLEISIFVKLLSEVGVSQNSSQVSQVAQIVQVAQMRNLRYALCLFFSSCTICVALYAFFSALAQFALRSMPFFFSACAICVCELVNLTFVAL